MKIKLFALYLAVTVILWFKHNRPKTDITKYQIIARVEAWNTIVSSYFNVELFVTHHCVDCKPGPNCSKLIMSLVNDSLKFRMAILQIHCIALHRILTFYQQKITVYLLLKSIYS